MSQSRGSKDTQLLAHGRATLLALAELVSDEEGSTQPAAKRPRAESADEAGGRSGGARRKEKRARSEERRVAGAPAEAAPRGFDAPAPRPGQMMAPAVPWEVYRREAGRAAPLPGPAKVAFPRAPPAGAPPMRPAPGGAGPRPGPPMAPVVPPPAGPPRVPPKALFAGPPPGAAPEPAAPAAPPRPRPAPERPPAPAAVLVPAPRGPGARAAAGPRLVRTRPDPDAPCARCGEFGHVRAACTHHTGWCRACHEAREGMGMGDEHSCDHDPKDCPVARQRRIWG